MIDANVGDSLAQRFGVLDAFALTDILRAQLAVTAMIANRHAVSAASTDHQALQQCGAFSRRPAAPIGAHRLCALMQALLVLLVLFPAKVARVSAGNQRVPLIPGHALHAATAMHALALVAAAVDECAGISRVVQDAQHLAMVESRP